MRRGVQLVPVLVAYAALRAFWYIDGLRAPVLNSDLAGAALEMLLFAVPSLAIVMVVDRKSFVDTLRVLGLGGGPWRGLQFGLLASLPMALVAMTGRVPTLSGGEVVGTVLLVPIAEEVLFRGLLFGALLRGLGWPLPLAIAASALLFGAAHAPSPGPQQLAEIVATAAGGALFAWVYYRMGSLWPAIALHACMNLWWLCLHGPLLRFESAPNAAGAAQLASIGLAVVLTSRRRPYVFLSTTSDTSSNGLVSPTKSSSA